MPKNFAGQNLRGKSFKGQDLTGADFSGADIRSANFRGANLTGANFCRARAGLGWIVWIAKEMMMPIVVFVIMGFVIFTGFGFFTLSKYILRTDWSPINTLFTLATVVFVIIIIAICIHNNVLWGFLASIGMAVIVAPILSVVIVGTIDRNRNWGISIGLILIILAYIFRQYIRRLAIYEVPQFVIIRHLVIWYNAIGGTTFQQADLTGVNFADADLKHVRFMNAIATRTNWQGAKNLNWARLNGTILADQAVRELLVRGNACDAIANLWQPSPTSFVGKNLKGAYLVNADLNGVDFTEADFSGADLQGANLRNANLTKTVMLGANLRGADVTGATLDAWNIDSATNLDGAFAEYVYLKANQQERRPQSGVFGDKEFSKLFQEALNTIDFIYKNGIDWQAFMISFDQLREHVRVESDGADISVQSIENKGDGVFVVRVAAPQGVNMAQAHQTGVELYQAQLALQEAKYQALLQGKDEQLAIYREWLNDKRQGDIRMDTIVKCLTEKAQTTYTQKIETLNGNVIQGSKDFATNAD